MSEMETASSSVIPCCLSSSRYLSSATTHTHTHTHRDVPPHTCVPTMDRPPRSTSAAPSSSTRPPATGVATQRQTSATSSLSSQDGSGPVSRTVSADSSQSVTAPSAARKAPQLSSVSAKDVAIKQVAKMFMGPEGPESLDKVEQLKRRTQAKLTAVHSRLKATMQTQLDDVKQGMSLMNQAHVNVDVLKQNLDSVSEFYEACSALREHTDKVRVLASNRDELRALHEQIQSIFDLREDVAELMPQVTDGQGNMLVVHNRIAQLEKCRDSLLSALPKTGAAQATVLDYFRDVKVLSDSFQMRLLTELSDPLGFQPRSDEMPPMSGSRLVSWLRIVELEERSDMANPNGLDRPKGLRNKLFAKLEQVIECRFDDKLGTLKTVSNFLGRFKQFFYEDLELVQSELVPRFPPYYDIFDRFLDEYHTRLFQLVEEMKTGDSIDPSEIMSLLQWVPSYKEQMRKRLGIEVEQRFPQQLLGSSGGEAVMRAQYVAMLKAKLDKWCTNLLLMETAPWFETQGEQKPPDQGRDGLMLSHAPKNLFQMLHSQVDVAFTGGHGVKFVIDLLDACAATLLQFVEGYKAGLEKCYQTYFNEAGEPNGAPRPEYLADYMMALINSCHTISNECLPELVEKVRDLEPEELKNYQFFTRPALAARKALVGLVLNAVNLLATLVANDLSETFKGLLTPKWLRSRTIKDTILATIEDYGGQIEVCVHHTTVEMVMREIWKLVLVEYVRGWCERRFLCKTEADRKELVERFKLEGIEIRDKVEQFIPEVHRDSLPELAELVRRVYRKSRLDNVIPAICHVAETNISLLNAEWKKLRADFPDATLHHLEAILTMREDMTGKDVRKAITDQIVKKSGDEYTRRSSTGEEGGAFFSLIRVPTTTEYYPKTKPDEKSEKRGKKSDK
eukprot:m.80871 g.80871  ORF g.80871 m.80871 type:complete len:904 (-) comp9374_c1_seq2:238-2949(-)